jgi:hypothetical protein
MSGVRTEDEVLMVKKFIDPNTLLIVCRGYPEAGLTGLQKTESSKRAALLNAYYFVKKYFDEGVSPDTDGRADKYDVMDDHAVVHYVLKKNGLKRLQKY